MAECRDKAHQTRRQCFTIFTQEEISRICIEAAENVKAKKDQNAEEIINA